MPHTPPTSRVGLELPPLSDAAAALRVQHDRVSVLRAKRGRVRLAAQGGAEHSVAVVCTSALQIRNGFAQSRVKIATTTAAARTL